MCAYWEPFLIIKAENKRESSKIQSRESTKKYWTEEENLLYIDFFKRYPHFAESFAQRKANKIFIQMSKYITTRTPIQIKSHHQKLLLKYKNIDNIINSLQSIYMQPLSRRNSSYSLNHLLNSSQENHLERQTSEGSERRSNQSMSFRSWDEEIFNVVDPFDNLPLREIEIFQFDWQ